MALMVFKGIKQVSSSFTNFEDGYLYFVRTNDNKDDGYVYFNGKKYSTAIDVKSEIESKLGDYPSGYANIKSYIDDKVSSAESLITAEETARIAADNTKQNLLSNAEGFSIGNIVLASENGVLKWKPFNSILTGSATPLSSQGNNGDLYIQTQ